jgi:hypothetical protein
MKKLLVMSVLLLVAVVAGAQTKIAPKMQEGMKKTYVSDITANVAGKEVKMTSEATYTVLSATATGYEVECTMTRFESNADPTDLTGRLLAMSEEMMKGVSVRMETDKDCKPVRMLNFEDIKKKTEAFVDKLTGELLAQNPAIADMLPKDMLKEQVMGAITEERMLQSINESASPMALNGKTISIGAQDEFINSQGMKLKRMYFPAADGSVTTNANINMSKEEMKQLIISQVEKMAPGQAEMIKNNIDMVMASGMLKFESNEKATYNFAPDGWVKSIKVDMTNEAVGQKSSVSSIVTLKE